MPEKRQERWLSVVILGAVLVTAVVLIALPRFRQLMAERRCGERHVFAITNEFSFLPDEFAVRMGAEALARQGFDTNDWRATFDSPTKAPDGINDRFLHRNVVNDHQGILGFTNRRGKFRHVQVGLHSNRVECVVRAVRVPSRSR